MALYRTTFERFNFGINPPLKQTADVIFDTDIPLDDAHIGAFEKAMWAAMWAQNPHWRDSSPPPGLPSGWSSVMGGQQVAPIAPAAIASLAWLVPKAGWLMADGVSVTDDPDDAGRFSPAAIAALQRQYPGPSPQVLPKLVSEVFKPEGPGRLMLRQDTFVVWGHHAPDRVSLARSEMGPGLYFDFPCPAGAQVYARLKGWGWRFTVGDGDWEVADSKEAALLAAKAYAVAHMRNSASHDCGWFLAQKHHVVEGIGLLP